MDSKQELFLETARKRFSAAQEDEAEVRKEAEKDLKYVAGDQWDEQIKEARRKQGRPSMTFNRCATFVQLVTNEARENKTQIKFSPEDEGDEDTAEVYEGLARHIQYESDAAVAYETAFEYAAGGSFGYWRHTVKYCDDESFDLELKVVPVLNPFAVFGVLYPTLMGREPKFAFVTEEVPKEEYKELYPDSELSDLGWEDPGVQKAGWVGSETVRIAEYWYVEDNPTELKQGNQTRIVNKPKVKFCKINGTEVIKGSETVWPGSKIPIICVLGKQLIINGTPIVYSLIRFQRDPQQLINFYKSRIAENCMVAPISPFIGAQGQFKGLENQWATANTTPRPFLEYNELDVNGKMVGPPQRQTFEPPIAALAEAALQEIDDMKATVGIYDASMGNRSNEQSGVAIERRRQQSNVTVAHFMDNLERGKKRDGDLIAEVIPKIYKTEVGQARKIRILKGDETPKVVQIGAPYKDEKGVDRHYDLSKGSYKPIVTIDKSANTKREETFDVLSQLISGNPELLTMLGDIYFKNSNLSNRDVLVERFKKAMPPNLQDEAEGQVDLPPQVKAQVDALMQQHQQMTDQLNQAKEFIQTKQAEQQGAMEIAKIKAAADLQKAQLDAQVEMMKLENARAIAEIGTKAQDSRERMKIDADLDEKERVRMHEVAMGAAGHFAQKDAASQDHAQTLQQGDQSHQQALEQADAQAANQAALGAQTHDQTLEQQQQAAKLAPKKPAGSQN